MALGMQVQNRHSISQQQHVCETCPVRRYDHVRGGEERESREERENLPRKVSSAV